MAHVAEVQLMSEPRSEHLTPMDVAAYVDNAVELEVRRRFDAHLADCGECRDEIVEVSRIAASRGAGPRSSARFWVPAAIAAALVFVLIRPDSTRQPGEHREAPVTTTVLPVALTPVGAVDSLPVLRWTSVPNADRYQVRVFDANGTVLWEDATSDTAVSVPAAISLRARAIYYWKVEAQTGFDRRVASELVEFSIRYPPRR